jgi:NitT/TauT family transport system substrate-binding protein
MRIHPDRRHFMLGSATSVAALSMPAVLRANTPLETLTFFGAPAGPSITLAYAVAQGAFSDIAGNFAFKAWRDPDELRAGLTSGTMKIVIMSSNAAANLYNRGLGVHMVNAMTLGLNSIMTKDPEIKTSADLKGRSITFPFRNDTPDILLRRVLAATDVQEDSLKIVNAAPPIEAVQLFAVRARRDGSLARARYHHGGDARAASRSKGLPRHQHSGRMGQDHRSWPRCAAGRSGRDA